MLSSYALIYFSADGLHRMTTLAQYNMAAGRKAWRIGSINEERVCNILGYDVPHSVTEPTVMAILRGRLIMSQASFWLDKKAEVILVPFMPDDYLLSLWGWLNQQAFTAQVERDSILPRYIFHDLLSRGYSRKELVEHEDYY